jgi:hypothetical protein
VRVLEEPENLEPDPELAGCWVPMGTRFGFNDRSLLLPSLRMAYVKVPKFKITMVITTADLIDIWYLDSVGDERLMSFRREQSVEGLIYAEAVQL